MAGNRKLKIFYCLKKKYGSRIYWFGAHGLFHGGKIIAARPTNSKSYFLMGDLSAANTTLALFFNNQLKQKWSYQNQKINNNDQTN